MLPPGVTRKTDQTEVLPISEYEFARTLKSQGTRVVEHSGRYWFATPAGFYHSIHWMARMTRDEASRPHRLCWGFQTTLCSADAKFANGTMPLHVLSDFKDYDLNSLPCKQRTKLRKCYRDVEFVEMLRPDLLLTQGYDVIVSAYRRTGYGTLPSQQDFKRDVLSLFNPRRGLVLGGLVDGRLKGFLLCYAIESIAYLRDFPLATDALRTNIGTGLVFEMIQAVRRSKGIEALVNSPHTPEKPSLCNYKLGMKFPIVSVPAFVWFAPLSEIVVKRLRPYAYYRLTGYTQNKFLHKADAA